MSNGLFHKVNLDSMADSLLQSFRPNMGLYNPQLFDSVDNSMNLHTAFDPMDEDILDGYDFLNQCLNIPVSGHAGHTDPDIELDSTSSQNHHHPHAASDKSSHHTCSCASHLMKQLVSMPLAFENREHSSFDVQLSELKMAVKLSKACMGCSCTLQDDMAMLMISILIGRVIQGFEKTLAIIRPVSNASSFSTPSGLGGPGHAPKLSWGTLEIDADEEDELKQHMWLLQFRKFRLVLNQFNTYIGRLGGNHGVGDSAQVMAYQCIHMWLAQKVDNVNNLYQAQEGYERIDRLDSVDQVER
ncbi:transcriptional regulator family: Fungal Specific TF [Penicillium vulpinum]|uniref:transcriptional regulator family: Fungal Specific TF n=1 Tax=Penicillium vulpinum TaxID=29845 RepID=UPI0025492CEF|nr:transcriptional regulator family: Fungal Specific TF [Penicillium vulpinum]KAJ5952074.1 transcriptional regulator family: Fungal Specific TF [Penicillium vulpinum]